MTSPNGRGGKALKRTYSQTDQIVVNTTIRRLRIRYFAGDGRRPSRLSLSAAVVAVWMAWAVPPALAATTATVCLFDSTGAGIQGAQAEFRSGTWHSIGLTGADGCVSTESADAVGNLRFRVTYNGQTATKTHDTRVDPVVTFHTVLVTGRLLDSTGTGIEGALIEYSASGWKTLGTTGSTGETSGEMLPTNRTFRVTYNGQTETKSQDLGAETPVTFQTILVTGRLLDSTGTGIEGALIEYSASGWKTLGTTDAAGVTSGEMLAANRTFRVTYNSQNVRHSHDTRLDPVVTFQTGRVLQGVGPRVVRYRTSSWQPFVDGIELLPGDVVFGFDSVPNQTHTVVAGMAIYVPTAPTAPVVSVEPLTADEGDEIVFIATFTDLEPNQAHTGMVDWGDGTARVPGVVTQEDGLSGTVTASHVYVDDGVYTVEVCVTDNGNPNATGCATTEVIITNMAPVVTITGAPESVETGTEVSLGSDVVDPGANAEHSYSWVVTRGTQAVTSGSEPTLSFTPLEAGMYVVVLSVDDGQGGLTVVTAGISVVDPVIDSPAPDDVEDGEHDSHDVATTTENPQDNPGSADPPAEEASSDEPVDHPAVEPPAETPPNDPEVEDPEVAAAITPAASEPIPPADHGDTNDHDIHLPLTEAMSGTPAGLQPPSVLYLIGEADGTQAVPLLENPDSPDKRSPIIPAAIFLALGLSAVVAGRKFTAPQ